jgi:hypothetical protein
LLRLDIRILTIASCAAKAGPPTVVALANVHGWKDRPLVRFPFRQISPLEGIDNGR